MSIERDAIQALITDIQFRRRANAVARYRANLIEELAYAETGINDPRSPQLTFTTICLRTERVKHPDRPESVGVLVGWFRLSQFIVGIQVGPTHAMLWDVQEVYDAHHGITNTLIQEPDKILDFVPVFKNPRFWYLLALTRSGERVCPECALVRCNCPDV